jgi:pimeloyl-ACP methyl ester carboxylesterase
MSQRQPSLRVEPFSIQVEEDVLLDLRARIRRTRLPDQIADVGWEQGTELGYLRDLLAYWANEFDWRAQERELNAFAHYRTELDGTRIHFVHERARRGRGIPLLLTHGWPSTFVEPLRLVEYLTDPPAHGIDGPAFDVVIPSLPGYGFSERPARTGVNIRYTAGLWHGLMRGLGYERYGAGGGDFGAGVATVMALDDPTPMIGLHLTNLDNTPYTGPGSRAPTEAERAYTAQLRAWDEVERGYSAIQSTKPQTVGYGLNDSPAGLAAWILEKWRSWTDSGGDAGRRLTRDFLLTIVTIYWVTETITSSMRDYFDNRWSPVTIGRGDFVDVPTAIAVFGNEFVPEGTPPREWAERLYDVRRWTVMPTGGHFAPAEEPELVARDIVAFFAGLSG